jgi:AcrR family transcriptional regulator
MNKMTARGRPIDNKKQQQQKEKLLDSALTLLAEKSYQRITIREIAQHAQVNSAMVAYYFTNKEGLFIALLDQMAKNHFSQMKQVFNADNPIKTFISMMINMLSDNSGFARLVHDEFIAEHSALSEAFIERFPKKMALMLPNMLMSQTKITDHQKAKYAAFSLITLIITPFIGESVRKQAWQISNEELKKPEWSEHIYALFMQGCNYQINKEAVK